MRKNDEVTRLMSEKGVSRRTAYNILKGNTVQNTVQSNTVQDEIPNTVQVPPELKRLVEILKDEGRTQEEIQAILDNQENHKKTYGGYFIPSRAK